MFCFLQHSCLFSLPKGPTITFLVSVPRKFLYLYILQIQSVHIYRNIQVLKDLHNTPINLILAFFQVCANHTNLIPKYGRAGKFVFMIYGCQKNLSVDHLWQKPSVSMLNLLISKLIPLRPIFLFYLTLLFSPTYSKDVYYLSVGGSSTPSCAFQDKKATDSGSPIFFLSSPTTFWEGKCRAYRFSSTMI